LSVQLAWNVALAESGPAYGRGWVQDTTPDTELPVTLAGTGCVYQPFESGDREGTIETLGPEPS
jgi:hypothetical protein